MLKICIQRKLGPLRRIVPGSDRFVIETSLMGFIKRGQFLRRVDRPSYSPFMYWRRNKKLDDWSVNGYTDAHEIHLHDETRLRVILGR